MRLDKNKKIKLNDTTRWTFRGNVSKLFDEHIVKSVPLYYQTNWLSLEISDFFLKDKSIVYDLGCSTGAFLNPITDARLPIFRLQRIGCQQLLFY